MTKTKTMMKGLLGATALTALSTGTAFAAGTAADTTVSNTFELQYTVGTVTTTIDNTANPTDFKVDRVVDLEVTSVADTNTTPGATDEELVFTVTNQGNDTHGYALTVGNDPAGGDFDATGITFVYYIDGNGDGILQTDGTDGPALTYNGTSTVDLAADQTMFVVVSADIPGTATDGQTSDIVVYADTLVAGGAGTAVAPDDGTADIAATENVMLDDTGTSAADSNNQGDHSATGNYVVAAADVDGEKTVSVFSQDGSGCATIPGTPATPTDEQFAIPGACVEYVITASNTAGGTATAISIEDILKPELTFVSATFDGFTGTPSFSPALPSGAATNCDGTAATCRVNMIGGELAGGSVATPTTGTVTIRALVK